MAARCEDAESAAPWRCRRNAIESSKTAATPAATTRFLASCGGIDAVCRIVTTWMVANEARLNTRSVTSLFGMSALPAALTSAQTSYRHGCPLCSESTDPSTAAAAVATK